MNGGADGANLARPQTTGSGYCPTRSQHLLVDAEPLHTLTALLSTVRLLQVAALGQQLALRAGLSPYRKRSRYDELRPHRVRLQRARGRLADGPGRQSAGRSHRPLLTEFDISLDHGNERTEVNRDEVAALPAVLDVPTAAALLGVGRSVAYELVRTGQWPTPVLRLGKLIRIPSAPLLTLLGVENTAAGSGNNAP